MAHGRGVHPLLLGITSWITWDLEVWWPRGLHQGLLLAIISTYFKIKPSRGKSLATKGWVPTEKTKKVWTEQRTGKKAKDSTKKLMSIQRSGEKNPNSLNWTVTDPTGHTHNIKALRAWCKENNYNYRIVYHSLHGWSSMKHGIGRGGRKKVQE